MSQIREWVPPNAPLDDGYWESLLRDGENGRAASISTQADWSWCWEEQSREVSTDQGSRSHQEIPPAEDRWEKARESMERGEILDLPVVGCNRGGLLVRWNDLHGFVPASHLLDLSSSQDGKKRRQELHSLVGTNLELKIIELDPECERFVLSERATRIDEERRGDLLNSLNPGDVTQGRVTNLCSFGAFVDLGGFEGLVHISELSWGRVDHPSDVLEPGQVVEVYVLNVDHDKERVGLSIKNLQPDPWHMVGERYHIGQIIDGVITHVVNFGAFVEVEDGLEGLIHVSELVSEDSLHPRDVVKVGDNVSVEVLNVDGERRRMGLKLQRLKTNK